MQSMGAIRVYVGIETNSHEGVVSLNRGIDAEGNRRALRAFRDCGLYCTFNVLIFDPDATLSGVEQNLVITSYSIHYTKLYDCGPSCTPAGRPWGAWAW